MVVSRFLHWRGGTHAEQAGQLWHLWRWGLAYTRWAEVNQCDFCFLCWIYWLENILKDKSATLPAGKLNSKAWERWPQEVSWNWIHICCTRTEHVLTETKASIIQYFTGIILVLLIISLLVHVFNWLNAENGFVRKRTRARKKSEFWL